MMSWNKGRSLNEGEEVIRPANLTHNQLKQKQQRGD